MKAKYHTKARRAPTIITVLLSSVCSLLTPVSWGYSFAGGTGEPNDPYQIATAGQLISIGSDANLLSKHFVLVADIDLDPNLPGNPVFDKAAIAPASSGREGTHGSPFTGVLDGNGRTISHLKIAGREYIGLFGQLASGAEVRDLGVVDIHITGSGAYVGGLAGYSEGAVTRCFSTGSVGGTGSKFGGTGSNVGGLVGRNHNGRLTQCYSTCAVSLTWRAGVGGLVGYNNSGGYVLDCYSTGAVTGGDCVGGLVGQNYGRVTQCYSIGEVLGSSTVGGLVGSNSGTTSGCFWDTQTSGLSTSAGGTGLTTAQMQDARTYLAAGWDFVDEVENGTHQIWQMPSEGGYPVLAILNGYTPPKLHGQGTPEDPYLISDAIDLGAMIYYSPYAHYRMAASINLSGIGWGMAVMPRFGGNFDGNHLTISDLTINGGSNLGLFGDLASGAEVKDLGIVDANVTGSGDDIGGLAGSSLGDVTGCYSTGAVNGAGLNVGGLVGSNGGHVIHCHSTGSVTGTGSARFNGGLGGLVGWNWGDVTQCHSTSVVFGCYDVGGLVGHNTGAVSQCFSTGEVSGFCLSAGGLVGLSSGRITNCYSTGGVSGNMFVGGLVGVNDGDVTWCYSTGLVKGIEPGGHVGEIMSKNSGDVTHCFWDIQTSGQAKSAGGIGLTTAQMKDIQTLLNAAWDFVNTWTICEGKDYPRLKWEEVKCRE